MVKTCPKCGMKNYDESFWCTQCNTKIITDKEILKSLIKDASCKYGSIEEERKKRYMEYVLRSQDYSFLYEEKPKQKNKINIKQIFTSFVCLTAIIALAFVVSSAFMYNDLGIMKLNSNEAISPMSANGDGLLDSVDSMIMTFYPDGTYEIKSNLQAPQTSQTQQTPRSNAQSNTPIQTTTIDTTYTTQDTSSTPQQTTTITEPTSQITQTPQPTTQDTSSTPQQTTTITEPTTANTAVNNEVESSTVIVTGTWKVDDGQISIEPSEETTDIIIPYDSISESVTEQQLEPEIIQDEKSIIINVVSSGSVTTVEVEPVTNEAYTTIQQVERAINEQIAVITTLR